MAKFLRCFFKKASTPMVEEKAVVYKLNNHCERCPEEIKRCIIKEKGVIPDRVVLSECVEVDEETGQELGKILATVQGRFDEQHLKEKLRRKSSKIAEIVSVNIVGSGGESGGKDWRSAGDNSPHESENDSEIVSQLGSRLRSSSISSHRGDISDVPDNVSEAASISSHGSRVSNRRNVAKGADVGSRQSSRYGSPRSSFSRHD